jgi:hypothetical protein
MQMSSKLKKSPSLQTAMIDLSRIQYSQGERIMLEPALSCVALSVSLKRQVDKTCSPGQQGDERLPLTVNGKIGKGEENGTNLTGSALGQAEAPE